MKTTQQLNGKSIARLVMNDAANFIDHGGLG
jgi:hypothetical protein